MSSRDAVQHQRLSTRDEFEDSGDESGQYAVAVAGHAGAGGGAARSNPARPASASAQKHAAASPTVDMFDDDLLDELEDELGIEVWRCPDVVVIFFVCIVVQHSIHTDLRNPTFRAHSSLLRCYIDRIVKACMLAFLYALSATYVVSVVQASPRHGTPVPALPLHRLESPAGSSSSSSSNAKLNAAQTAQMQAVQVNHMICVNISCISTFAFIFLASPRHFPTTPR
jgi:hypothetical protein